MGMEGLGLALSEALFSRSIKMQPRTLQKIHVNTMARTPSNRLIDNNAENRP